MLYQYFENTKYFIATLSITFTINVAYQSSEQVANGAGWGKLKSV